MAWNYKFTERADKSFAKLDKAIQQRILKKLASVCASGQPTASGKALVDNLAGLWRYRVGDYRVICTIEDNELIVLVVDIEHRSVAYKN